MQKPTPRPIYRSSLRLYCGAVFFTFKRCLFWSCGGIQFAKAASETLEYEVFSHATPLIRKLKDVDMHLQHNKIVNLKIATKRLHGVILRPGETFSYWKLIGKPTKRKGYLDGLVLKNGTMMAGTGGGLCQLSNMIYWMTLHTPLTVIERHRHGYDVFPDSDRTQPFGSGATCFYNYGDLMIRNDTDQLYQLELEVTADHLRGAWRSNRPATSRYRVYEKEHVMQPEYWGGYTRHNVLYRQRYDLQNNLLCDEYVVENHAIMMYAPYLTSSASD